jgi:hypothetical protein
MLNLIRRRLEKLERKIAIALNLAEQVIPVILVGTTPGVGANESVELMTPDGGFITLEDGKSYGVEVNCVVSGVDSLAGDVSKRFVRNKALVRQIAGAITIVSAGLQATTGDAATDPWTLSFTRTSGPLRLQIVFDTVAATALCNIIAEVSMLEVPFIT